MLWAHCGPLLITDLFQLYCHGELVKIRDVSLFKSCKDLTVLPASAIQPIKWSEWQKWFEPKSKAMDAKFQKVQFPTYGWEHLKFWTKLRFNIIHNIFLSFIFFKWYYEKKWLTLLNFITFVTHYAPITATENPQ